MKARQLSESQYASVTDLVRVRTGLAFARSRRQQAEAGIRHAMDAADETDADRFIQLLHANDRALQGLIENLTVAETYFFRERDQFEVLRRLILPQLGRQLQAGSQLRLWSAGCATGEEPYSLAILLEQEALAGRSCIIATDISRAALARARKASYGAWSFRDNPPDAVAQYFHRHGDKLVLVDRIRRQVEFDSFNLASENYPSRITGPTGLDVIMCRNVLIYFDPDAVERVAGQMFASLKEGGWLITGPSDPPLWQLAPFETVLTPAGVLYRRRGAAEAGRKQPASTRSQGGEQPLHVAREPAASLSVRPQVSHATSRKSALRTRARKAGDHDAAARAKPEPQTPCVSRLQTLADSGDLTCTAGAVTAALEDHPLSPEIHYFQAILLMGAGRYDEAAASLRRAIYLDRSMAVAHFVLGSIQQRRGSIAEARRSFRNVLAACDQHGADEIVPFSDGEQAGRLAEAARAQLALIGKAGRP